MAQPSSIPEEIAELFRWNAGDVLDLPPVINLAFSGERKPEAWHIRTSNRQVSRGFNKGAPVTIMLPLKVFRRLMKKKDPDSWREAIDKGQIHLHGAPEAADMVLRLFGINGEALREEPVRQEAEVPDETAEPIEEPAPGRKRNTTTRKQKAKAESVQAS